MSIISSGSKTWFHQLNTRPVRKHFLVSLQFPFSFVLVALGNDLVNYYFRYSDYRFVCSYYSYFYFLFLLLGLYLVLLRTAYIITIKRQELNMPLKLISFIMIASPYIYFAMTILISL